MAFEIINKQGSKKRQERLQKELDLYSTRLNNLALRSHRLLAALQELSDKKKVEKLRGSLK